LQEGTEEVNQEEIESESEEGREGDWMDVLGDDE
jgi:hypothetical protein